MTQGLPQTITDYSAGNNARDYAQALSAFAPEAAVHDEARQHSGAAAIQRWMEDSVARYNDQSQVLHAATQAVRTVVAAEVSGTFPGSPIVLRDGFTLRDGLTASLAIDS